MIQRAAAHVQSAGKDEILGRNVLVAIFREPDSHAAYLLERQGHHAARRGQLHLPRGLQDRRGTDRQGDGDESDSEAVDERRQQGRTRRDPLAQFTTDLVGAGRGRAKSIRSSAASPSSNARSQVLCRRRKNNPIFVGEAGVGKTAIAEGLALQIIEGEVPEALQGRRDLRPRHGRAAGGHAFRGDFEERLKAVIAALSKRDERDPVHRRDPHDRRRRRRPAAASMDASNMLKPVLASGELRCIGSTTYEEYKNHFETDRALARRFQKIDIAEPSRRGDRADLEGSKRTTRSTTA